MSKRILFQPSEYRELDEQERGLLAVAYDKALDALRRNITPKGFSACSLKDNAAYGTDVNYRAVWARDGAITAIWTLDLEEPDIRQCQADTLRTLWAHQSPAGQVPANVRIDDDEPEYTGVGGICSIDSVLWMVIATYRYAKVTGDWSMVDDHGSKIQRAVDWLAAHDSNNCGLLEIPEAGDWTDLFARSYHVLYDEILWLRALQCYAEICRHWGDEDRADGYAQWASHVGKRIIQSFWPTTGGNGDQTSPHFADAQYSLGDSRYLLAQVTPFGFSWRCDVYANLLAYLANLVDKERAMMTFRFLWGVGVNDPWPVENLYPPVQSGDPEWRSYYAVNLLNLPSHYHNGGIWPFIGGMWVRYIYKLGMTDLARRELVKLAQLCALGAEQEWEFNEWHHGTTGRPMGKAFQAWSAASFLKACHDLNLDHESIDDT